MPAMLFGLAEADLGNGLFWLAIFFLIVPLVVLACGPKKKPPPMEIALRDLSVIWTRGGAKSIHIAELSPLWRDEKLLSGQTPQLPDLENQRAAAFLEEFVRRGSWFDKAPLQQAVCGQILKLLDQEGHCPSVVNLTGDVEGSWDENTFRILARTSLLDHSLNVAGQAVRLLGENESWHVIPDAMIAALGHDLGKLESMRGYLYSLGEHPLAAGRPLAGIADFADLPRKDEILRAIKLHHKLPDGLIGKTLKKADQLARQQELEEMVSRHGAAREKTTEDSHEIAEQSGNQQDERTAPTEPEETSDKVAAAWQAQADIYGEDRVGEKPENAAEVPQLMDISAWFEAERFLAELKPFINKMFGRRFLAFSMPDGHVYFQTKVLEEVARKQAERAGCMKIATMAQKDPTMRRVLLSIVQQLRVENDIIARGLIKDNFFGGYFTVTKKIGKGVKGYYTPFNAEVFGSLAEMEREKSDILRDIRKVSPCLNNESPE